MLVIRLKHSKKKTLETIVSREWSEALFKELFKYIEEYPLVSDHCGLFKLMMYLTNQQQNRNKIEFLITIRLK